MSLLAPRPRAARPESRARGAPTSGDEESAAARVRPPTRGEDAMDMQSGATTEGAGEVTQTEGAVEATWMEQADVAEGPPPADQGALVLANGIVVIAAVAGLLEVIQRLRGSRAWPVPLVIYSTLLPITLFFLLGARAVGADLSLLHVGAVLAPAPLILLLGRRRAAA